MRSGHRAGRGLSQLHAPAAGRPTRGQARGTGTNSICVKPKPRARPRPPGCPLHGPPLSFSVCALFAPPQKGFALTVPGPRGRRVCVGHCRVPGAQTGARHAHSRSSISAVRVDRPTLSQGERPGPACKGTALPTGSPRWFPNIRVSPSAEPAAKARGESIFPLPCAPSPHFNTLKL